ncbi:MAG: phenylacetate--CoA ligase family protein [Sandaracinaceae bacterium]
MSGSYVVRAGRVLGGLAARPSLARRERWPRERLLALQQRRLERLVRHAAARSPFWARRLAGALGSKGQGVDLARLPAVDKAELIAELDRAVTVPGLRRAELDAHLAEVADRDVLFRGRYRVLTSGGSSGRRAVFVYGPADWRRFLAGVFRWSQLIGLHPGYPRPRVASVSAPDAKHMTFRGAASIDVGLFNALRLPATLPVPALVDALESFRPTYLFAYASMAALLAEEQLAGRLQLSLRGLCTTSELRTPDMTERIRAAFGVAPFDCYATTETGIAAVDCEEHAGHHIFEDLCILEPVDARGRPVPDGQPGEGLLLTNLCNLTQPMIRVRVDDLATVSGEPCPCGRTLRRLVGLSGRADDVLRLPGAGAPVEVHPIHLRSPLGGLRGLAEYRIVQRRAALELTAVPTRDADAEALVRDARRRLADALARAGVSGIGVDVRLVPQLERQPGAGKLKVVQRLTDA